MPQINFCLLVMGVAGSGKSTLAKILAAKLKARYIEADDFHSPENKMLMAKGIPLQDKNRVPWLESLNKKIWENQKNGINSVLACSALKEAYRKKLALQMDFFYTVFLKGSEGFIGERLGKRKGHFFNPELLRSQFAQLQEPKTAWTFSIESFSSEEVCEEVLKKLDSALAISQEPIRGSE